MVGIVYGAFRYRGRNICCAWRTADFSASMVLQSSYVIGVLLPKQPMIPAVAKFSARLSVSGVRGNVPICCIAFLQACIVFARVVACVCFVFHAAGRYVPRYLYSSPSFNWGMGVPSGNLMVQLSMPFGCPCW